MCVVDASFCLEMKRQIFGIQKSLGRKEPVRMAASSSGAPHLVPVALFLFVSATVGTVGAVGESSGGSGRTEGTAGEEETAGEGICKFTQDGLVALEEWFHGKISAREFADRAPLSCIADTLGKGIGQVAGATLGATAGGRMGGTVGERVASRVGLSPEVGRAVGSLLGGLAGGFGGWRAGVDAGSRFARLLLDRFLLRGTPSEALVACRELFALPASGAYDAADVKQAYRRASLEHHPDRSGGSSEKMTQVNLCYEMLRLDVTTRGQRGRPRKDRGDKQEL